MRDSIRPTATGDKVEDFLALSLDATRPGRVLLRTYLKAFQLIPASGALVRARKRLKIRYQTLRLGREVTPSRVKNKEHGGRMQQKSFTGLIQRPA
ncbi:MAG: hypothetical protein AB1473_23595 [Thermodesulfobacteriota bacterium]